MIVLQIIYVIIGILGIITYIANGKFLTLNLATMFLVGGILSFVFSTWWWLLAPLFDAFFVRPIVFLRQNKLLENKTKK